MPFTRSYPLRRFLERGPHSRNERRMRPHAPDPEPDLDPLASFRRRLDAELGPEPMIPEKFSMLALAFAAGPLALLAQVDLPVRSAAFGLGAALPAVWLAAFLYQRLRYDRFEARWNLRARLALAEQEPPHAPGFLIFR
jgi:hypothetical protein